MKLMEIPKGVRVFYEGRASEKSIPYLSLSRTEVRPFAGVLLLNGRGNEQMGVGIYGESNELLDFDGYEVPHNVISSCRAVKILEKLPEIRKGDLDIALWTAHRDSGWYKKSLGKDTELISRIGDNFRREEILKMVPENLDKIITLLKKNNIGFSSKEIVEEIRQGVLKPTNT
jgi:hypothetical protein